MSSPSQANTSLTPVTGTKRRYLGTARRKRTTEYSGHFSPGADPKQQCSNLTGIGNAIPNEKVPEPDSSQSIDKQTKTNDSCELSLPTNETTVQFATAGTRKRCLEDDLSYSRTKVTKPSTFVTPNRRGPHHRRGFLLQNENSLHKSLEGASSSLFSPSQSGQSTPIQRIPSMPSFPGSSRKRFRHDFKSPLRNQQDSPKSTGTADSVSKDIESLKQTLTELQTETASLRNEGYCEDELQTHISKMHEYNELKDTGQMLLGKIALIDGVTTKDLYERFGLELDD